MRRRRLLSALGTLLVLGFAGTAFAIISGRSANDAEIPWAVQIWTPEYKDHKTPGDLYLHCSGALIDSGWVLTARHCIQRWDKPDVGPALMTGELQLIVGRAHDTGPGPGSGGEIHTVDKIIPYKSSTHPSAQDDLMLLKLDSPSHVAPARVADIHDLSAWDTSQGADKPAAVAGWGYTDASAKDPHHLQKADVALLTEAMCRKDSEGHNMKFTGFLCTDTQGSPPPGTCEGDSGGPLYVDTDRGPALVGIVRGSLFNGERCASAVNIYAPVGAEGKPNACGRNKRYIWIMKTIGHALGCADTAASGPERPPDPDVWRDGEQPISATLQRSCWSPNATVGARPHCAAGDVNKSQSLTAASGEMINVDLHIAAQSVRFTDVAGADYASADVVGRSRRYWRFTVPGDLASPTHVTIAAEYTWGTAEFRFTLEPPTQRDCGTFESISPSGGRTYNWHVKATGVPCSLALPQARDYQRHGTAPEGWTCHSADGEGVCTNGASKISYLIGDPVTQGSNCGAFTERGIPIAIQQTTMECAKAKSFAVDLAQCRSTGANLSSCTQQPRSGFSCSEKAAAGGRAEFDCTDPSGETIRFQAGV